MVAHLTKIIVIHQMGIQMTASNTTRGLRGIAASLLLAGVAAPALAENNWYVGFEYNRVLLKDAFGKEFVTGREADGTFCVPPINVDPSDPNATCVAVPGTFEQVKTTYEDDNGFALSVGYDFAGAIRVDISAKRMRNAVETTTGASIRGDIESTALMTNVWYDFNRDGVVQPYVGVGVGAAKIDFIDEDDTVLFGQAGLGLNFKLSDAVFLDLGARYFESRSPEFENLTMDYRGTSVVLGVRFNFPGDEAEPAGERDSDGDGVPDARDRCPGTPLGTKVNAEGCADSDGDGVIDTRDLCPGTPPGTPVDVNGCSDIDGDGISDRIDSCPNSPPGQAVMSNGCAAEQSVVLDGVNFEFGSAKLEVNAQRLLDRVGQSLLDSPTFVVELQGHTDNLGPDAYNLILSQDRANAVKAYLIGKGVEPERMVARGYGERQPAADNGTEDGRTRNRRVEMKVLREQ